MTHKLTLTEDQWNLLLLILSTEQETYAWDVCKEHRATGRRLGTILTRLRKYKHATDQ